GLIDHLTTQLEDPDLLVELPERIALLLQLLIDCLRLELAAAAVVVLEADEVLCEVAIELVAETLQLVCQENARGLQLGGQASEFRARVDLDCGLGLIGRAQESVPLCERRGAHPHELLEPLLLLAELPDA